MQWIWAIVTFAWLRCLAPPKADRRTEGGDAATTPLSLWFLVLSLLGATVSAAAPPRFLGRTAAGDRLEGRQLTGWHSWPDGPALDGRALLTGLDPVVWLVDRRLRLPATPAAYVEFFGGDRLPGTVLSFRRKGTSPYESTPSHFVVKTASVGTDPRVTNGARARVLSRTVKRLVWAGQRISAYQPSTAFLKSGDVLAYRSLRLDQDRVHLLLANEQREVPFAELAELHFPAQDPWASYFSTIAVLCCQPTTRCHQVETVSGLLATTSDERFRVFVRGDPAEAARWTHGLQPDWSLDLLWISHSEVRVRRFWRPDTVPLTRLEPTSVLQQGFSGSLLWTWRRDTTVRGIPLSALANPYGWGFGIHGSTTLDFSLPPAAIGFRADVALDLPQLPATVEAGVQIEGLPVAQSCVVSASAPTRRIEAEWTAQPQVTEQLRLSTKPPDDAPQRGGAILEIANSLHWGDPQIILDRKRMAARLDLNAGPFQGAWRGWVASRGPFVRQNVFLEGRAGGGHFGWCLSGREEPLVLKKEMTIPAAAKWLVVDAVQCRITSRPATVEISIDQQSAGRHELSTVTDTGSHKREPVAVSLSDVPRDRPVSLAIRQLPGQDAPPVLWRAIGFARQHPSLYTVFEDGVVASESAGEPYSGVGSVRVSSTSPMRLNWGRPIAVREHPEPGEYRFVRFAFRATSPGVLRLAFALEGAAGSIEYTTARDSDEGSSSKAVVDGDAVDEWIVVTRDMFADFGPIGLVSLTVAAADSTFLWDHCYFARTRDDFERASGL
jgi:hypothetical protein